MRQLSAVLVAIALSMPGAVGVDVDAIRTEQNRVHPVELELILARPEEWLRSVVSFRCTFAELGSLYDRTTTYFRPERFHNLVVWDDRADLSDPAVRGNPVASVYLSRVEDAVRHLTELRKYQTVEITARVAFVTDRPWFEVLKIRVVDQGGAWDDTAIWHVQQAQTLVADGALDIADTHFAKAMSATLPIGARPHLAEARARALMQGGHTAEARVVLEAALVETAADPKADGTLVAHLHAQLAKAQTAEAEPLVGAARTALLTTAVEHANAALASDPAQGESYAVLGIALAGLGRFDEARQQCDIAIRMRPNDAEVRWYLGRILDLQGRHDEAIEALKKAIDLTPKDARIHKAIASAYFHRAMVAGANGGPDLVTALREYDISLRLTPKDADAWQQSGVVIAAAAELKTELVLAQGKVPATTDLAIERWRSALALDPKHAAAHENLVAMYRRLGQTDAMMDELARMVGQEPDNLQRVVTLAELAATAQRIEVGAKAFDAYLAAKPQDAAGLLAYSRWLASVGDSTRAAQLAAKIEKLYQDDSRNSAVCTAYGEQRLMSGDIKGATELAERATKYAQAPADQTAAAVLTGKVAWAADNVDGTIAALAPQLNNLQDPRAASALAWAYLAKGKPAEAAAAVAKAALATDADELRGVIAYQNGDFRGAETLFLASTSSAPLVKSYRLGMAIYAQGQERFADAKPHLEQAKGLTGRASLYAKAPAEVQAALAAIEAAGK